jgi:hypothetical protein
MTTAVNQTLTQEIGVMAGRIWHTLEIKGEMSIAALKKSLGTREPAADWAIGWLAREDKIALRRERNMLKIALR